MPRTPEETLAAIEDQAADDDMESVLAMSREERRAELARAGFDLAAGDAQARARHVAALAASNPVTPIRRRSPLRAVMLAAAGLAFAVAVVGGGAILLNEGKHVAAPYPGPAPAALREAAGLRRQAADACDAKKLPECIDRLERARVLDPDGDESPEARAIHDEIDRLKSEAVPR
jgi:hypothetical protein